MAERKLMMTCPLVFIHPHLLTATLRKDAKPGEEPTYSLVGCLDEANYTSPEIMAIREEVVAACVDKWGREQFDTYVKEENFDNPFRKDVSSKKLPSQFIRYFNSAARLAFPPGVFLRDIDPATGKPRELKDPRELYHGVIGRVSIVVRAYGGKGTTWKPGAKLDMRNWQKLMDGPRLEVGGSGTGGSEFDKLPPLPAGNPNAGAASPLAGASALD